MTPACCWHNETCLAGSAASARTPGDDVHFLAPEICRQRLVVEGRCVDPVDAGSIRGYLSELSKAIEIEPAF
jgi:hypothetical protein